MTFGAEERGSSTAAPKTDENKEGKDPQAAEPLREGTPEQDRSGYTVQTLKNSDAGGGKTAHRLKKGVDK